MKKKPFTPNYKITRALRKLYLESRERGAALKRDGYSCQECGKKQSKAKGKEVKVQVHHIHGIDWEDLRDMVRKRLLQNPDALITYCVGCHEKSH